MWNWVHECSLDWLKKRQEYLTASDVRQLIPVTKTGRERKVTDDDRLKVLASKMVELTEEDCMSYGAAARGHIMEPYALMLLKQMLGGDIYWWDDEVIPKGGKGGLAFSPDGLDVPDMGSIHQADMVYEVKSYSPERHLATAYARRSQVEERWQIATAMAVMPELSEGWLVLFCPKLETDRLCVLHWYRDELRDEIAIIEKVESDWLDFMDRWPVDCAHNSELVINTSGGLSEQEIIAHESKRHGGVMRTNGLNPM